MDENSKKADGVAVNEVSAAENHGDEHESNEARRQRLLGVENNTKIHDGDLAIKKGKFFDNLWYRHKWAIIIGAIFLFIAIVFIVQMASVPDYDLEVSYFGPQYIDNEIYAGVTSAFGLMLRDYNEDGEKNFNFAHVLFQNASQRQESGSDGGKYGAIISEAANAEALRTIQYQFMSGEVVLYLVDKELYENHSGNFVSVESVLGYKPDEGIMCGENAIYLHKTEFGQHFKKELGGLPSDTVVCVLKKIITVDDDAYAYSTDFFKSIVEFKMND